MTTTYALWAILALPLVPITGFMCAFAYEIKSRKHRLARAIANPGEVSQAWVEGLEGDGSTSRLLACFTEGKRVVLAGAGEIDAARSALAQAGIPILTQAKD